jgi:N-carbamoyl-D-amino-acid hydrolase
MSRIITVAAAQMGPIQRSDGRTAVVKRMLELLRQAAEHKCNLIGGSCIIAPTGQIVAQAVTLGDELVVARCDLDLARSYKATTFNFARHRQPAQYRLIVERTGAQDPE